MKFPVSYDDIALEIPDGNGIYIPAEDSILLLDMLKEFLDSNAELVTRVTDPVLDMGAGNGLATLLLARYFTNVHAVDINPFATRFIRDESKRLACNRKVHVVAASLLDAFRKGSTRYFLACFNPPYLPPEDYDKPGIQADDVHDFYIDNALYAPEGGKQVLESFLKFLKPFMIDDGHVFFIKSSLTGIDDIDELAATSGFRIVSRVKIHRFFEDIEGYHAIA